MKRVLLPLCLLATFAFASQAQNTISTVAGGNPLNGTNPTGTGIEGPYGVVRDASGNLFVFTDQGIIYKVTPGTVAPSTMSVYAGAITAGYSGDGGPAGAALLNQPFMGTLDASGNLYFSDAATASYARSLLPRESSARWPETGTAAIRATVDPRRTPSSTILRESLSMARGTCTSSIARTSSSAKLAPQA